MYDTEVKVTSGDELLFHIPVDSSSIKSLPEIILMPEQFCVKGDFPFYLRVQGSLPIPIEKGKSVNIEIKRT